MSALAQIRIMGQSMLTAFLGFFMVYPATRAFALGVASVEIPTDHLLSDLANVIGMALIVVTPMVEILRRTIPWLSRKDDKTGDAQKSVLRASSVAIGAIFGLMGAAPAIMDGSNPQFVGGIASGGVAALFGPQLFSILNRTVKSLASATKKKD